MSNYQAAVAQRERASAERRRSLQLVLRDLDHLEVASHEIGRRLRAGEVVPVSDEHALAGLGQRVTAGLQPFMVAPARLLRVI